ncbi:DUF1410 domain-containing protein [Mesomycoplasma hyopneumoniae]|uniref:DUF1410 domain-containing protein n=1 Tax=Mesomycoplasma hyopneumoniae TaxID=2099 RepID=UPI000358FB88|nr:DUF1410 domain-containing protein [Mesomycoplasma hyopneumoniae]AGQ51071.1 hypothetical protein MHL_3087 [Mesomycoplasma hyopneumoniae 7422]
MDDINDKKSKKAMKKSKRRAIILSLLAFGGLSVGSFGFLPFLLKSWNTLQYNIVDFRHINQDNINYEIEFALSDLDSFKLNYQDLNVDLTKDKEGKEVVATYTAIYDEFSRYWRINSKYSNLSFGRRYYLKVYLDDKKQKRFSAKKVIGFGQNVTNFVDTPPAVSTINFEARTPSTASVSVKFADEAANLEGKKVALEYYYVLKNQADDLESQLDNAKNAQEIHTSYVDAGIVKDGKVEFALNNLHPGLDYKISAIRYVDTNNRQEIPLSPMQKIALDPKIDFEKDSTKKRLFETKTAKFKLVTKSLIDQNLSFSQKRVNINFDSFESTQELQNKIIKMHYKDLKTSQTYVVSAIYSADLASFDLNNLDPGRTYQIESFELEGAQIEFGNTFIKNFYTPAAVIDSKIAIGATFANVDLTIASADNLAGAQALLYLDDSSIIPTSATFFQGQENGIYKISFKAKGLVNDTKYALDKLLLISKVPNSVFSLQKDGYDYKNILFLWNKNLEISSPKRNFITTISDLKTFIKLEPKILASKVEYTFGFLPESAYLNDKNLYLYYYKKDNPAKLYKSKVAKAEGSEIKFDLEDFEVSSVYKLAKIEIAEKPNLALAIQFDLAKSSAQKLPYDEFFIKYRVSEIKFDQITETSAKVAVSLEGDFKNSVGKTGAKNEFSAKLVFGQPGFGNLSSTIKVDLAPTNQASGTPGPEKKEYILSDNKLILHFNLENLDPKTEYQVVDLEIPELAEFFSSSGILEQNAKFSTSYKKIKIFGSNFDNISETSAIATIYFDPTFNSYLNNYKFKVKFKDENNKIVSYPNQVGKPVAVKKEEKDKKEKDSKIVQSQELENKNPEYIQVVNNAIKVSLSNLEPGKKYEFAGLESAPGQDSGLTELNYEYLNNKLEEDSNKTQGKPPYFYTIPQIQSIKSQPQQDSAKIIIDFNIKDPNFGKRPSKSDKNAIIFLKNNANGAAASEKTTIKFSNNTNTAEFDLKNLEKLSHYTITELLLDSQRINFAHKLQDEKAPERNFYTVATTASVVKIVQFEKKHNKIGLELTFDPVRDIYLKKDQIKVMLKPKNQGQDAKTIEATGNVDEKLVLKLNFENTQPGTEYEIEKISNLTKDKNIQTSVGFEIKAQSYAPGITSSDSQAKIYSAPELLKFEVQSNKNEQVKVKLSFKDAEQILIQNSKQLTLLMKNEKTNAIITATGTAKNENGQISAEFDFKNLDRNQKYTLVSINDYSQVDSSIWVNPELENKKSFNVNVDKIEVKNLVYSDIKSDGVKAEIYFDPIRDGYLENQEIEVEIIEDKEPKAQFQSVSSVAQQEGQTNQTKKVKIIRQSDGRLVASLNFDHLKEGTDFKIKGLKIINKNAIFTNEKNQSTGPKFEIVNEFTSAIIKGQQRQIGEINEQAKQKTLKFATDIVISDVEFNPSQTSGHNQGQGQGQQDLQRSATIKITFSNSNNEILKLNNDQVTTLTLRNKKTGKVVLASAKVQENSGAASATFEFKNNLDKFTEYEISSLSVVRTNGIYQIPFGKTIKNDTSKTEFKTKLSSIKVVDIKYSDLSPTSVLLTTFFDSLEDGSLNNDFEATLEYELKNKGNNGGQNSKKTSKVAIENNQASFQIENLGEATGYTVKNLEITKKPITRSTRSKRSTPENEFKNLKVEFDQQKVETPNKKDFFTKSLISSITINKDLIKNPQSNPPQKIEISNTNLSDTSAGIEIKIKDPKKFFEAYSNGKPKQGQVSQIHLMIKSQRTGAIFQAQAQISYQGEEATAKFSFENLEKYSLYSIVDIFVNGVPVGFLRNLTQDQKKFHTTAKEVLPESISQTEYRKHGAVIRMVFDVNKNWFLVNNKIKISFKKQGDNVSQDAELTAEAVVKEDGLAIFDIQKDQIKNKVPSGTRYEITKMEFLPQTNTNQAIIKHFPLAKYIGTDQNRSTSSLSASQDSPQAPSRKKRDLSLFSSGPNYQVSEFATQPSPASSTNTTNNFAAVSLKLDPLSQDMVQKNTLIKTFDTAAYVVNIEKVNLSGNNAEIKIKLNTTKLLEKVGQNKRKIKLKYIDITSGQEKTAELKDQVGQQQPNSSSGEYTFSASDLKPLNYYQLVSVVYENNGKSEQVINFDDDSVTFQDKLFRTTPASFSVVDIQRTLLDKENSVVYVKIQLDEQSASYLEGYKVKVSYKRQDKTNSNTPMSVVEGIIQSDGTILVKLEDIYDKTGQAQQKQLSLKQLDTQTNPIKKETNTLISQVNDPKTSSSKTEEKQISQNKIFEGFKYKIEKVELIEKPVDSSKSRKRRSTSVSNLIDFNKSFNTQAEFKDPQGSKQTPISQKQIIEGIPIRVYDQIISTEEKDKTSGINTKIYAWFISSEDLKEQDQDKKNFKVQLYNKTLNKLEIISQATKIEKIDEKQGQSHLYVISFETNLNKASLYEIQAYFYKGEKIDISDYKTDRMDKTEFTTPAKKAWLTNFSQIGAYEDEAATVYFQFDEKDEYLWRNKHKIEVEIQEVKGTNPDLAQQQQQQQQQLQTTKFVFVPEGPISKVRISKDTLANQNRSLNLNANTAYRITKFTIKDVEVSLSTQGSQKPLSDKNQDLKIDTIDLQNQASPSLLGTGGQEVKKVDSAEVVRFNINNKAPFFETRAKFNYLEDVNWSQDENEDADGRSGTIKFSFNDRFLQIPKEYGTITVVKSSEKNQGKEISFTSKEKFQPVNKKGVIEFRLEHLDRFETYEIKKLEIGGVEIPDLNTQAGSRRKRSLSQTKSEFTPIIQKIFVADVKQVNVRTGSSSSQSSRSSSSSGPEEGEEVKGFVNLYFDKNDAWINNSKIDVKIKEVDNQNPSSQVLVEKNNLQVSSDNQNNAIPYVLKINLDTTKEKNGQSKLKPGQKIEFELEIKENAKLKSLEGKKQNIKVKVDFPKNQYNLANTPKLEKQVRIPPVVKEIKVTTSSDTDAELEVELVGNKTAFKDLEKTPIVITIEPDPDKEARQYLPFETKKISKVGQIEGSTGNTIKVKYNFNGLIPFLKYKVDKIKWGVYDIPFGNNKNITFKNTKAQGSNSQQSSQKEKEFQMPFDSLPQDKIKLVQQPWAGLWRDDSDTDNYNEENIDIDLDPVYMWSLNKTQTNGKQHQNLKVTLESANKDEKTKKVTLPFSVKYDMPRKTLTAKLINKKVTDYGKWTKENKWKQLLASTRYVVTKIESNNGPSLTLANDDNNNNKLTFTTQIEEPDLHTIRMTDFSNPEGRNDTWEQSLILKFYDPWKVLDETKLEQWNFALYNNNNNKSIKSYLKTTSQTPNTDNKWRIDRVVEVTNNEYIPYINPHEIINEHVKRQQRIDQTRVLDSKNKNIYVTEAEDLNRLLTEMGGMSKIPYYYELKSKKSQEVFSSQGSQTQTTAAAKPSIPNPSPYRYFKWTLKGDGSWIEHDSISLELRAYYFRKPDRSSQSTPTSWYDHQTEMQGSSQVQSQQGSTPEEEPINMESRESKEKDKRKDHKYPIRVNSRGRLIKIENWKQKTNVAFIRETSSEIVSGVGIKIKAKLYDPRKVRKNANKVKSKFNRDKFEENISKSISVENNYNQAVQSLGSESNKSNVSLTLSWSEYKINNEFSSLLNNPNQKWSELVNKIEKKVKWTKGEEKNKDRVTWSRQWETKQETPNSKKSNNTNEVELGWFITYKQPQRDRDNSKSHRYRIGFKTSEPTKNYYQNQILTPWNEPKVFLTGATYPQVDKTDPFWGNIFTNQAPGLYRSNSFSTKLDKLTGINWDNTIFIGPSSRVKKTSAHGQEPEVDRNIKLTTQNKQKQMKQKPFGIYDIQYDQNSKTMTVGLYTKTNQGQEVKFVQEVMPSVMYGWFINNQGDMYLIGNEIGLPIILWRDADFSQQLIKGKITIKLKLQNSASDPRFSPKPGEQLKFLGILVFPHLPPNPNQNPWLREKKHTTYSKDKYYKEINNHKYIMPMHNDQSMTVDAETPYVITWVRREDIWKVITV